MIICCGYVNLDVSVQLPTLPDDGARVHASAIERHPGGMAANVANAAARFGIEVGFVGAVGDDPDGRWLLADLRAEGIDVTGVAVDRTSTLCLILVTPDGQRAIVSVDDAVTPADVGRAHARAASAGGLLYLDGYRWPAAAEAITADAATTGRATVVTDLDGCPDRDGLEAAMRAADHVLCSRDVFAQLAATADATSAAVQFADQHDTTVVLTAGADGWWATAAGRQWSGGGIEVEVVDTTGAGDAFCGAYIAELHAGAPVPEAAAVANAAAGLSTRAIGARDGLVDRRTARDFWRTMS